METAEVQICNYAWVHAERGGGVLCSENLHRKERESMETAEKVLQPNKITVYKSNRSIT